MSFTVPSALFVGKYEGVKNMYTNCLKHSKINYVLTNVFLFLSFYFTLSKIRMIHQERSVTVLASTHTDPYRLKNVVQNNLFPFL